MGVYAYIKTHTCTHTYTHTHARTHTLSLFSSWTLQFWIWSQGASLGRYSCVLLSGYFMTATGKERNDNRPIEEEFLVVLWLLPMIHMCAPFFTQTEVCTHYWSPPHLYRGVPAVRKLVQPKHLVWAWRIVQMPFMNSLPVGTLSLSQCPWGNRTGQDRRNTTPTHKAFPEALLIFLGYIIGTFLKQIEIIRKTKPCRLQLEIAVIERKHIYKW